MTKKIKVTDVQQQIRRFPAGKHDGTHIDQNDNLIDRSILGVDDQTRQTMTTRL